MTTKTRFLALAGVLALAGANLVSGPSRAASYDLTTTYGDGGSFRGEVTFTADESAVESVTGYLYDYSPTHGYTGHAVDVTKIDTYAGSCSPVYTSVCFSGGVWTNETAVSGVAFDYAGTAGLPVYLSGYDGDASGHYSTVSTGYFSPIASVSPAPEPSAWALLITGVGLSGFALRRRRRRGWAAA